MLLECVLFITKHRVALGALCPQDAIDINTAFILTL